MGRQLVLGVVVQASIYLQSLVLFPIVIRHAGTASYGKFVLVVTLLYVVFGLYASAVPYRYRRELVSAEGAEARRKLFAPQFTFQLVCLAAIAAAIAVWFAGASDLSAGVLIAWLAANTVNRCVIDYFRYTLRLGAFNFLTAAFPYLFLLLVIAVAVAHGALSVERLLWLQVAALVVPAMLLLPRMLREIGLPRLVFDWRGWVADFRQGAPLTADLVIDFLLANSDRLLIALFLSVTDVGRYQPAYTLGTLMIVLPRVSDAIVLPNLIKLIDDGRTDEAERVTQIVFNVILMIAIPFAVAALFLGPTIIAALTNADIAEASRWVTPIVACAAICYGVMLVAGQVAFALRRTRAILMASALGGAANVTLNLSLLPLFANITIPAATTLIGYGVGLALIVAMLRRIWRFRVEWPAVLRYTAAAAAMALLLDQLGYRPGVILPGSLWGLAGTIAAGTVAYFAVLLAVGGIAVKDFRDILGYAARP